MFLLFLHSFNDVIVSGCAASSLFHGLSFVAETQGSSLVLELRLLNAVASLVLECGLEGVWASVAVACGISSCGTRAWLLHGTGDPPGPGIEHVSPALAGGFFTTEPPRVAPCVSLLNSLYQKPRGRGVGVKFTNIQLTFFIFFF